MFLNMLGIEFHLNHQIKLQQFPIKTELLFIPADSSPYQDLVISLENSLISPLVTAHNLRVTTDIHMSFPSSTSEGFFHFFLHRSLKYLFSPLSS